MKQATNRYRMVHFFGPDGAGKSTQVERLAQHLERRGYKVRRAWVRSPHTFAFLAMQALYLLGLRERLYNPSGREFSRPVVNQSPLTSFLWVILELVSVLPLVLREAVIPARLGQMIVAERYVLDTAATIGFFLQDEGFIDTWPARLLYRFLLRDTLLIFLDADYESVLSRRGEIAEPREFIDFQRRVYRALSERLQTRVIYTPDHTIEETHQMVLAMLGCSGNVDGDSETALPLEVHIGPETVRQSEQVGSRGSSKGSGASGTAATPKPRSE